MTRGPGRPFLRTLLQRVVSGIPQLGKLLSAQGLPFALIAVVNVVMVSALSPAERGRAAAVVTAGTLVASVGFLNLQLGVVARYRQGALAAPARGLCVLGLVSGLLMALALVTLTVPARSFTVGVLGPTDLAIGLTGASLALLGLYAARVLQGLEQAGAYLRIATAQAVAYGLCIVGLAATGGLTARTAAVSWAGGAGVAAVVGCWYLAPLLRAGGWPRPRQPGVLAPALSGHVAACAYQLLYRADLLLLATFASATEVGRYALAVAAAELVWQVAEALALSVYAQGPAALDAVGSTTRLDAHLRAYRRIAGPLALLSLLGLTGAVLVLLPAYRESVWLLLILLPGVLAGGELRIRLGSLNADSTATHRVRLLAGLAAGSCLVYLPAISAWHAAGAAAASTTVYGLNALAARWLTAAPTAAHPAEHGLVTS